MKLPLGIIILAATVSGCSAPIKSIDRLPMASELGSAVNPELIIARASEDIGLLKAKKDPKYATFKTGLYDGGTRFVSSPQSGTVLN